LPQAAFSDHTKCWKEIFFYGGESLLQDMTARVLQRRKRTVTLMASPVYDAAAALRAGSFGIGQINA